MWRRIAPMMRSKFGFQVIVEGSICDFLQRWPHILKKTDKYETSVDNMLVSPPVWGYQHKDPYCVFPTNVWAYEFVHKIKGPSVWQQCPRTGKSQFSGTISRPFRQCTHDVSPLGSSFWTKNKNPKTCRGLLKRWSEIVWEQFFEFLTCLCIKIVVRDGQQINLIGEAEVLLYLYELGCLAYHWHTLY